MPSRVAPLTNAQQSFIEDFGMFLEPFGLSPAAGQIIALLMVSDPPELTLAQISYLLDLAKSTVSTTLKTLMTIGFLTKTRFKGDRKDYYMIDKNLFERGVATRLTAMKRMKEFIEMAKEISHKDPKRDALLEELVEMYQFFHDRYKEMIEDWNRRKSQ